MRLAAKITKRELEMACHRIAAAAKAAGDSATWSLEAWSPGDGYTRYRVERNGLSISSYTNGKANAYALCHAIARALEDTTRARAGEDA